MIARLARKGGIQSVCEETFAKHCRIDWTQGTKNIRI